MSNSPSQRPAGVSRCRARPPAATPAAGTDEHERIVTFRNAESARSLVGTLLEVPRSKKAVILCHGFASHRDGFHFPAIARALARKNVTSLRFDFSGNGDSEGPFEFGNYASEARDIRAAAQFLQSLNLTVSGLLGHSKGAGSALLYTSIYDDIPNVVNVAGRFDMLRGIQERFGDDIFDRLHREKEIDLEQHRDDGLLIEWTLTKWSMQERVDTDMRKVASAIRLAEVLTVHGTADRVIPVADAHQWGPLIPTHQLITIEGADHSFLQPAHAQAMITAVVEHLTAD